MIDPLHVFHQVQEGQAPSTWRIYRPLLGPGRTLQPAGVIAMGIFIGMMLLVFSTIIIAAILAWLIGDNPFKQPSMILLIILVSLSIAIATPIASRTYGKRKSDAVLILLPEGVVSCERCSDETKRAFATIDYANVKFIMLKVIEGRYINTFSLGLQHKNQKWESWKIDRRFGDPEEMAQRIITDHALYTASTPRS